MKIVHTYINNMYIDQNNEQKESFANKWGLVSLADQRHEVTLICGGNSKRRKEYQWRNIRIIELPSWFEINNTSRLLRGLWRELKNIDADIFHTHHYSSFVPEITILIGWFRSIPTYITFHNSFLEGNLLARILGGIYLIFMQPFLLFYTKTFFISSYLRNYWMFAAAPRKRIVYNQLAQPPNIHYQPSETSLVYLGRVTHQKGVDILIKALYEIKQVIPNITLQIIGTGTKKYIFKIKSLMKKLNLQEQVQFRGALYGYDKWKILSTSVAMIVPSRDEAFGNVVVEAQACGIPVVVSDAGSLCEAAGGQCKSFANGSSKDLATAIITILRNPEVREKLSVSGKKNATKFSDRNIGEELIHHYTTPD